jgi:UDP-GlcNAc:undecaprenyl-phosphate/decaprenyl-phosphate GlcNAc-1-phosphate transferase
MRQIAVLGFAAACVLSLALTLVVRSLARRFGFVAQPREDRWHRRPTALLGGVAIALAFAGPVLALGNLREVGPVVALALLLSGLGLADDLRRLNPASKLVVESIAAAGALFVGYRLGWTGSLTIDSLLTLLWLVGLANAFNLLDNMDGLAAGVAAIGALAYLVLVSVHGAQSDVLMLAAYLGATCGFLVFNFQPASIFMGDAGSLFLGFTLALLAVRSGAGLGAGGTSAVVIPVAVLSVPIFDTTLVTFVRSLAGRRISVGGRDHSSHRLVALGLPERRAVLVLYACAALAAAAGLSAYYIDVSHANIVLGLFLAGLTLFGLHLAQVRVYQSNALREHRGTVAVVLKAVNSRTRLLDVLLDISVVTLAYYTAYRIRFDDAKFVEFFPVFLQSLPIVVATTITSLWWTGAYRGIWRYFGGQDAVVLLNGTVLAALGSVTAASYLFRFQGYSRAVFAICGVLTFAMLAAGRASFRFVHELTGRGRADRRRVVVYGAGDAGLTVLRESRADRLAMEVVGFVDDDAATHDRSLQGVRVLGGFAALLERLKLPDVDGVLVSGVRIPADRLEVLKAACRERGAFLLRFRWGFQDLLGESRDAETPAFSEVLADDAIPDGDSALLPS